MVGAIKNLRKNYLTFQFLDFVMLIFVARNFCTFAKKIGSNFKIKISANNIFFLISKVNSYARISTKKLTTGIYIITKQQRSFSEKVMRYNNINII